MDIHEREMPWIKRVEDLIKTLDGSTIGELELREAGMEIIIRRQPDMLLVPAAVPQASAAQPFTAIRPAAAPREDRSQAVTALLTGVYYSSPSPAAPAFVKVGDVIHVGQVVALIEAMKVFNEIQSEIAGRVVALVAQNGEVVQKGEALLKVEPL